MRGSRLDHGQLGDLVEAVLGEHVDVGGARQRRRVGQHVAKRRAAPEGGANERPADRVGDARQGNELVAGAIGGLDLGKGEGQGPSHQAGDAQPVGGRVDLRRA